MLPLRGKWLIYLLVGGIILFWVTGFAFEWRRFSVRAYLASSPSRPYPWHVVPHAGLDCQHRMMSTDDGEVARSLRLGDLVVEVSEEYELGDFTSGLSGCDCH